MSYLGLGGNHTQTPNLFEDVLTALANHPSMTKVRASRVFITTPVSPIPQPNFFNAAVELVTSLSAKELFSYIEKLEQFLGKTPKTKDAPRPIDIDLLIFGKEFYQTPKLTIPHPKWMERLFVLAPLSDLADEIPYPINEIGQLQTLHLPSYLKSFSNPHRETVFPLQ